MNTNPRFLFLSQGNVLSCEYFLISSSVSLSSETEFVLLFVPCDEFCLLCCPCHQRLRHLVVIQHTCSAGGDCLLKYSEFRRQQRVFMESTDPSTLSVTSSLILFLTPDGRVTVSESCPLRKHVSVSSGKAVRKFLPVVQKEQTSCGVILLHPKLS